MNKTPKTHHVVPNSKGGWDVKRGGAERASSHHETKHDAIQSGRTVSRNQRPNYESTIRMAASPVAIATAAILSPLKAEQEGTNI